MRAYILIFVAVLLCGAAFAEDLFDSKITFYSTDTKAFITDSTYAKIADIELMNPVTKSGGQLWLQDCGLFTCSLYVDFTPTQEYILNEKDFGGVVVGSDRVHYSMASLYEETILERTRPTYTEKLTTIELCTTDNATLKTTCKNETKTEMVQTGVETYEETIGEYKEAKDGTVLKAGEKYRFRFDYSRDRSNEVADLQPKLFNTVEGWAWWNSTWTSYREQNVTCTSYCVDGNNYYLNITTPSTVSSTVIRFTSNSTGTEVECPSYADTRLGSNNYIVNCTLKNGTTAIKYYYNNASTVSSAQDINTACRIGEDFASISDWTEVDASSVVNLDTTTKKLNLTNAGLSEYWYLCRAYPTGYNNSFIYDIDATNTSTITTWATWGIQITETNGDIYNDAITGLWDSGYGYFYGSSALPPEWCNGVINNTGYTEASPTYPYNTTWVRLSFNNSAISSWTYDSTNTATLVSGASGRPTTVGTMDTICISSSKYGSSFHSTTDWSLDNLCAYDNMEYMGATFGAWGDEINYTAPATAPTLQSISLYPATLYKNMTASCAVNWTHPTNATFTVYQGLTINGTIEGTFNQTNTAYTNGTIWNYTSYPLSVLTTHGDKISCWSMANSTDANSTINYTANITVGNWPPDITSTTITSPLMNGSNCTGSAVLSDVEGDTISCTFIWWKTNDSIIYINPYNSTQSPCLNTSILSAGNYTVGDYVHFNIVANDSLGNSSSANSVATLVLPTFSINNYTWTGTQYESLSYLYSINYSIPAGNNMTYTNLEYNSVNVSPTCTNVSTTYYCSVSLYAPPVAVNGTAKTSYWYVNYTDGVTPVESSTTFTQTVYYGVWATDINSIEEVAMGSNAWVNLSYSNVSGFGASGATLSASAELGGNTATLTCASGICAGNVVAPTVTTPTIYRTSANYTVTSSYWTTSVTRTVLFETVTGMETSTIQTTSGTITNPTNYNDTNWATYATINYNAYFLFNYTLNKMANFTALRTKDTAGTRNDVPPEECWGATIQFKAHRYPTTIANYSCYSYEDDAFVAVDAYTFVANYYMYEENLSYTYNNSYTRVVPYGIQVCSGIGTTVFHYNAYDEGTLASLVVTYAQAFELDTGLVQSNHSTSGSDNSWDICYYPDTLTGNVSSFEEFSATGYADRNNFLNDVVIEDGPYNVSIYLLNSSDAKLTIVTVKENGLAVEGAMVYIQRYYPANTTFTTVATLLTDDTGKALVYLNPNGAYYKFVVLVDGVIVHTSSSQQVICDPAESMCSVLLNIVPSQLDYWTYYGDISGACTVNLTNKSMYCVYADTHGTLTYARLIVTKTGVTATTTICDTNSTSASGTLHCALGAGATGVYTYYLMGKYNPEYSLDSGSIDLGNVNIFGGSGLLLTLLVFLTLAFIGVWSPPVGIIFGLVGLGASYAIGMVDISWAALAAVFVSGIILAIKMRS